MQVCRKCACMLPGTMVRLLPFSKRSKATSTSVSELKPRERNPGLALKAPRWGKRGRTNRQQRRKEVWRERGMSWRMAVAMQPSVRLRADMKSRSLRANSSLRGAGG